MSLSSKAQTGYGKAADPTRTPRGVEYAIFAKLTHRLKAVDESDPKEYAALATAAMDNQRLWFALAEDLANEGNALPAELRSNLIGLAEFVRRHTSGVLSRKESVDVLIDINTAVMRGLRGDMTTEEAAV